eukprot:15165400-Alexandrium_andersonii.AAC.2
MSLQWVPASRSHAARGQQAVPSSGWRHFTVLLRAATVTCAPQSLRTLARAAPLARRAMKLSA